MDKVEIITKVSKKRKKTVPQEKIAMDGITKAMQNLNSSMIELEQRTSLSFEEFLKILVGKPSIVMRDVFQVFHDMVKAYVSEGVDEYPDDPESIQPAGRWTNLLWMMSPLMRITSVSNKGMTRDDSTRR